MASVVSLAALVGAVGIYLRGATAAPLAAVARRGPLTVTLTEAGVLRAAESVVYRSPLEGREVEITFLAPEGVQVGEGDLLVRLDTTALKAELERAVQAVRQAELELQSAEVDRQEAALAVRTITEGAGTLAVEEARTELRLAEARANRLREEHARLQPLLTSGYITREELERAALELDEAEARRQLTERGLQVLVERTRPAEEQNARLQLSRRETQLAHVRPKLEDARAYTRSLETAIERCSIRALRPGLVVYEDNFSVMPRRKIRVGDRVTSSQGLITLPDLRRMLVSASVRESDVHLVRPGQTATVRVDAFPDLTFPGTVARLGALAQGGGSSGGDARFDLAVDITGATATLRPGMNARVDVIVAERQDVLTVPVTAVFVKDGVPVCYVVRGRTLEPRMVEVGMANHTDVEIREGLRPGERVSLVDGAGPGR